MKNAKHHRFQVLTKRSRRLAEISGLLLWPPNVWIGVTVENEKYRGRIDDFRLVSTPRRFVSMEPLLGSIPDIDLFCINHVIVGGESGPGARPMEADWARGIRDQCLREGLPFMFKQWGGVKKKDRVLDGQVWDDMPE